MGKVIFVDEKGNYYYLYMIDKPWLILLSGFACLSQRKVYLQIDSNEKAIQPLINEKFLKENNKRFWPVYTIGTILGSILIAMINKVYFVLTADEMLILIITLSTGIYLAIYFLHIRLNPEIKYYKKKEKPIKVRFYPASSYGVFTMICIVFSQCFLLGVFSIIREITIIIIFVLVVVIIMLIYIPMGSCIVAKGILDNGEVIYTPEFLANYTQSENKRKKRKGK